MEYQLPPNYMEPPVSTIKEAGDYDLRIIEAVEELSKKQNEMITLEMEFLDHPDSDHIFHWLLKPTENDGELQKKSHKRFHETFKIDKGAVAEELLGLKANCRVKVDSYKDDSGNKRTTNRLDLRGEIVPAGRYDVVIKSAELAETATGKPKIALWHEIQNQGDTEDVPVHLVLPTDSTGFVKDLFRSYLIVFSLDHIAGVINDDIVASFVGSTANVAIRTKHDDRGNRNELAIPIIEEEYTPSKPKGKIAGKDFIEDDIPF